ncbi:hypothetical protein BTZ20_5597 [Rhodococcus sp. MTM3W5.2]|nr:hypothetical protein BTZ20_5597 [Rhodococcus sp. MTM3W5.2]
MTTGGFDQNQNQPGEPSYPTPPQFNDQVAGAHSLAAPNPAASGFGSARGSSTTSWSESSPGSC